MQGPAYPALRLQTPVTHWNSFDLHELSISVPRKEAKLELELKTSQILLPKYKGMKFFS